MHIRWMIRRDMTEVMAIDQEHSAAPWPEQEYLGNLRQRNCIGMVAELGETLYGHMVYELHTHHLDVLKLEASNDDAFDSLLSKLTGKLSSHRRTHVVLHVHERDDRTIAACRRNGWRAEKVEREHYGEADAYLFVYHVNEVLSPQGEELEEVF